MEKDNTTVKPLSRSERLANRVKTLRSEAFWIVLIGLLLYLQWDRPLFLWLGDLLSHVPVLNLLPRSTYTDLPLVLDAFLLFYLCISVWNFVVTIDGIISDTLETSFLKATDLSWNCLSFCAELCAAAIFFRLAINPAMFPVLWLRQVGDYAHDVWALDKWNTHLVDFLDSVLGLIQTGLQVLLCLTALIFVVHFIVVCVKELLRPITDPRARKARKARKASAPPKASKPKLGISGLRKDVAQEADLRLQAFLSVQEPPEAEDSYLRVQITDPREINPDQLHAWNDRHEIYLRLADYEFLFLRQDGKAYLLGSEKLELQPNVPEVVWVEGRTKGQKLILTYIV